MIRKGSPTEAISSSGRQPDGRPVVIGNDGVPLACAQPEGPLHPYAAKAALDQLVVGRWLHCSGPTLLSNEEVGIEFDADGNYYELALEGSGLVRLTGFDHQGTWDTYQETPTSVQLSWHPSPGSGNGGFPQFEDDPRRLAIAFSFSGEDSIYIRAD